MYPRGELAELAERKLMLQARIAVRRWECAEAVVELSRPIAMVDRGVDVWRRFAPYFKLFAVPAGLLLTRLLKTRRAGAGGKLGLISMLFSALPAILRGVKVYQQMRTAKAAREAAAREKAGVPGVPVDEAPSMSD